VFVSVLIDGLNFQQQQSEHNERPRGFFALANLAYIANKRHKDPQQAEGANPYANRGMPWPPIPYIAHTSTEPKSLFLEPMKDSLFVEQRKTSRKDRLRKN
jgi:hypothetical protein